MGAVLLVLAIVMGLAGLLVLVMNLKDAHERAARSVMTPAEEAQFEIVTEENVVEVLDHQMMKSMGEVSGDHPAYAARKAESK